MSTIVELREIFIAANRKIGAHVHPRSVIGEILSGQIVLQVDGQPEQTLNPGDAFYEPADTMIRHFDTSTQPAKFVASFLLAKGEQNSIRWSILNWVRKRRSPLRANARGRHARDRAHHH